MADDTEKTIRQLVERVRADEASIGALSTSEYLAVALVLDRKDLLVAAYTMQCSTASTRAALAVQRSLSPPYR